MEINIALVVAVIVALSEVLKNLSISKKYVPLLNIFLGMVAAFFLFDGELKIRLLNGLICGLVASGVFDLTKFMKK